MDTSEYLGLFLDESRESLQALNASLLDLERDPAGRGPLTEIFRVAHSLKGMSATMGFEAMARLTHRMEEELAAMRDGGAAVTPAVTDVLLACLDLLGEMVDRIEAGDPEEVDAAPVIARLDAVAGPPALAAAESVAAVAEAPPVAGVASAADEALSDFDRMVVAEAHDRGLDVLRVEVAFDEGCRLPGVRAFMIVQQLERFGDLVTSEPSAEVIESEGAERVAFWLAAAAPAAEVRAAVLGVSEIATCEVSALAREAPGAQAAPAPAGAKPATGAAPPAPGAPAAGGGAREGRGTRNASTVRVGTERIDALMNLMGEMVIQRTRLDDLSRRHGLPDLRAAVEDLGRVTGDLQALIMQVRMMPVESVFMRFPRMVRDLANTLGKRVDLRISGEDTELDRTVIDGLGDPLVHMLRNAVDHGLESPEERAAAGKDPVGVVSLSAAYAGNCVIIEVRDDGRGMDPAALRASVVRKGLMDEAAANALSDAEALELVFLPGFSTASVTTDVSGRGVGMDAVRSAITALSGEVTITSAPGEGSAFTIRLPLTLAIIQALLVTAGAVAPDAPAQVYAVPLESIEETVVVGRDDPKPVGGRPCLVLRDTIVPLVRMRDHLGGHAAGGAEEGERVEVVVVSVGGRRVGLVVDGMLGKQDVVIKHLPGYLGDVPGVAGATILGDGAVALIVDVPGLAALAP
ncbi:chemotaxis protein CheA [Miltoncostaea marina]|uniref:chemotaxis protein CheA n=1 Tax=Miltoncostaea marina TaxID=2843215 RepID=UPI001C3CDD6F|nr:chemotaxis protein CheA [Miltoncostaea marina]